jgi:hypothetical protein
MIDGLKTRTIVVETGICIGNRANWFDAFHRRYEYTMACLWRPTTAWQPMATIQPVARSHLSPVATCRQTVEASLAPPLHRLATDGYHSARHT